MAGRAAVEVRRSWLVVVADIDGVKAYGSATIRCCGRESNGGNAQFRREIVGWRRGGNIARIGAISGVARGAIGLFHARILLDAPVAKWRLSCGLGTVSKDARRIL